MKRLYLRTILLFLGIVGVAVYIFFAKESKTECLDINSLNINSYGDSSSGVLSLETNGSSFKCVLFNENGNCGIGLSFKENFYKNFNLIDTITFYLKSSADFKELIVNMLVYSKSGKDSLKPMLKELQLNPNQNSYSVPMSYFYTPPYWLEQQRVKETGSMKPFSKVAKLELYSGWKNPTQKPLEIKLENICLKGANNLPFVALVIYIGVLIAIAISVRIRYK